MQAPAPFYDVAEVYLSYKNKPDISKRPKITASKEAYHIFLQIWDANKIGFVEEAKILLLNRSNSVLGVFELSSGGMSGVTIDPKLIFIAALKANASGIILAHNHPSENLKPSREDLVFTKQIKEAGRILTIEILDHLIVTPTRYYSFADEQIL